MGTAVRIVTLGGIVLAIAVCATGCGPKVQAQVPEPPPPLAVPEPPARVLMPIDPPPPPATPVETPVVTPPVRPAGRGAPPPATAPPPTTAPPPDTPPPPVLQTGSGLAELEQRAKERLGQAQKDMARLTRSSLGKDAQAQYDSAASFIRLAQNAITVKNFIYAHYCADKAATLAGLLVK